MVKFFCLVLASLAILAPTSKATPVSQDGGALDLDDLLNAKGIFQDLPVFSQYKAEGANSAAANILSNLKELLNDHLAVQQMYTQYKEKFGKEINPTGDEANTEVFRSTLVDIATHNIEARNGLHLWEKGINQFTDITDEQYEAQYTGYTPNSLGDFFGNSSGPQIEIELNPTQNPSSIDWVQKKRVGPIRDQGNCGSCVMYASAGLIESINAIKKNGVTELSPQQLLDCAQEGKDVCKEGSGDAAPLNYVKSNGLASLQNYPIRSDSKQQPCQKDKTKSPSARISGWSDLRPRSEAKLMDGVAKTPISTGITSPQRSYTKGIFEGGSPCGPNKGVNHAINVVGYGEENGKKFWLIKNSYGTSWGEKGYMRLIRDKNNACKIGTDILITAEGQ